jgi:hypothetical protein
MGWLLSVAFVDQDGSSAWADVENWARWNSTPLRDRRSLEEEAEFIERYLGPLGIRVGSLGVQQVAAEMDARSRSAFRHVRALADALPIAMKAARDRPPTANTSEVWVAYALYRSADTIDRALSDAPGALRTHPLDAVVEWGEVINHELPTAGDVAAALLALEKRGWLVQDPFHFGLSGEVLSQISRVVGRGTPTEELERLRRWMGDHRASASAAPGGEKAARP